MTDDEWRLVQPNLFGPALPAVEPRSTFRWDHDQRGRCRTWMAHSSQALAIDVFGYLKATETRHRNVVFDELASVLSLPAGGDWSVDLEWVDPRNRLREHPKHPTQVDVLASSEKTRILVECKFAEYRFSQCSQTNPIEGKPQCNGNYALQRNPLNGDQSRCALSGKGIRYWDVVPDVFELRNDIDHAPCPFRSELYQWMRNVVLGQAISEGGELKTGFVAMYAAGPGLWPAAEIPLLAGKFQTMLRPGSVAFAAISYQQFLQQSLQALRRAECHAAVWESLIEWVEAKIGRVAQS